MALSIVVIELEFHVECLATLSDLLASSEKIQAKYFVNSHGAETLSRRLLDTSEVYVQKEVESKQAFLSKHNEAFSKADVVFIATLEQHWKAYKNVIQKSNVLLRVHGLNYHFSNQFQLVKGLKQLGFIGVLREFYWRNHYWKKVLQSDINYFTPTLISKSYLSKIQSGSKWMPVVPLSYFKRTEKSHNSLFTIVIPGSVEENRRNYNIVIEAISYLQQHSITWVLLGEMKSDKIMEQLNKLKKRGCLIEYFTETVSDSKFEEQMKKCDLVFAPVTEFHPFKDVVEIPGDTKISGATSDALLFGKPILLPSSYLFQEDWSELGIYYKSVEDIQSAILSLMNGNKMNEEKLLSKEHAIKRIEDIFTRCLSY